MSSIAAFDNPMTDRVGVAACSGNYNICAFNNLTISQQRSFDISLSTTDSDTVTIHSSSQFEAVFSSYNRHGMIDGKVFDISVRSSAYEAARKFSLSIEGTLDKEETRDIHKAVQQVDKYFRRLQEGDLKHAIRRISKLDKLDSISGLQATLQTSQGVSLTQQTIAAADTSSTIQSHETAATADG